MLPLRILAIDPALTHTGLAVFEYKTADLWQPLHVACIVTAKEVDRHHSYAVDDRCRRIDNIFRTLQTTVATWQPQLIAAELPVGGGKSSNAVASMAIATAIIVCLATAAGMPLRGVTWDQVKLALVGSRNASKLEMQQAADKRWPVFADPYRSSRAAGGFTREYEHVADALGVALVATESDVAKALIKSYGGAQ